MALRCASPFGARPPERSSNAVTAIVPASRGGGDVAAGGNGVAPVHAPSVERTARPSATRRIPTPSGARAARRAFLRVDVLQQVIRPRIGRGFGLVDGALDLGRDLAPHALELAGGHALRDEVCSSLVDRILRQPFLERVLRAITAVVVVRAVGLVAVTLRLDDARPFSAARAVRRLPGLRVDVEHVGAVGDEAGYAISGGAI